jgi:hypothetical protein
MKLGPIIIVRDDQTQGRFDRIDHSLSAILQGIQTMTDAVTNLQTADVALKAEVAVVVAAITKLSADLQAAIAAQNPAAIQAVADDITAQVAALQAAVPAPAPL